jgi:transcription initiation factor TFIIIB Brf1 subunit/transcription initiation factor TFIIB
MYVCVGVCVIAYAYASGRQLLSALNLPQHVKDPAVRLYRIALENNFVYGRKQKVMVAVCVYTMCRHHKLPFLLIDFSDAVQENVFILAKTFVDFVTKHLHQVDLLDSYLLRKCVYTFAFARHARHARHAPLEC